MASKAQKKPTSYCVGAPKFVPAQRVEDVPAREEALAHLRQNDFRGAVTSWFQLPDGFPYVYHAMASVTLEQVQSVVNIGAANGLHAWYRSEAGEKLVPPPSVDIEAYISIFLPSTSTPNSLKAFVSNAKKGSIRQSVATHLISKRYISTTLPHLAALPKSKKAPPNPYFDFWAWSCRNLEWAGPTPTSEAVKQSHHVLPVLMHHFGCAVPSHEALMILKSLADGRVVADIGSGCGFWTFMLRQYGVPTVPIDSGQSEWRTSWVSDTLVSDGEAWLARNTDGKDAVLLLVYPIVGAQGEFTRGLMAAYKGDVVATVGSQNHNGYTSFKDATMDEYMEREHKDFVKVIQVPLPSFAGKDEALFVFRRKEHSTS